MWHLATRFTFRSPSITCFDYQLHKQIVDTRSYVFVCSRLLFKQQFIYMAKSIRTKTKFLQSVLLSDWLLANPWTRNVDRSSIHFSRTTSATKLWIGTCYLRPEKLFFIYLYVLWSKIAVARNIWTELATFKLHSFV